MRLLKARGETAHISFDEGCRARIGLVLPSINTVVEPWFSRAAPEGVSVHAVRMRLGQTLSPESIISMDQDEGMQAVRRIADCRPSVIAYCCTASSVVQGQAYDQSLREHIKSESGAHAVTAASSIVAALTALGLRRIGIVSPYTEVVDNMEHRFFSEAGFDIVARANLGIADTFRLAEPDRSVLLDLGHRGWHSEAQALVLTCLNTRSHYVAEELEASICAPVVTATTATLWHSLRSAGLPDAIKGYGRLMEI